MEKKRFDRQLWLENDKKAKTALLAYLGSGWRENEKRYDPDLVNILGTAFAECEIKQRFSGSTFQYDTVQLPQRKGKWKDLNITYYILNVECTHAIKIPVLCLDDDFLKEVRNKFVFKGEYFYCIPMEYCEIIDLRI